MSAQSVAMNEDFMDRKENEFCSELTELLRKYAVGIEGGRVYILEGFEDTQAVYKINAESELVRS